MLTKINKQRLINAVKYTPLSYINKLLKIFYYFLIFYFAYFYKPVCFCYSPLCSLSNFVAVLYV